MLLARRGHKVLVVDRATFPSDTISTHILWAQGAAALKRWGLLDKLAATGCPPTARNLLFDFDGIILTGGVIGPDGQDGGFGPRRTVLDKMLVDAAVESGAELREAFTVEELLWDDGRVVGIRGHGREGGSIEEGARIVAGADGVNSFVAKSVGAEEYSATPPLLCYYYSYFSGFAAGDIEWHVRNHHALTIVPTHAGLTMMGWAWPSVRFREIRSDVEGNIAEGFKTMPGVAERFQNAKREEKWMGTSGVPNYFRKAFGPGWALVGDAGYERDPITAQGISDAFLDAESLAESIDSGLAGRMPLEDALADHQTRRDKRARSMYKLTLAQAALEPLPEPMKQVYRAMQNNEEATRKFFAAATGSLRFSEFMNPANLSSILASASEA
jgi:2-polyprenyl-6-methoxyphenol hydroxylase-like FAD-dependent oxidoreductase